MSPFYLSPFQISEGWRLPTAEELASAPDAVVFLFPGANVPFNDVDPVSGAFFDAVNDDYTGAAACAPPYFNTAYSHCDWQDGQGQPYGPWDGLPGAYDLADMLLVRERTDVGAVPEPASMLLLGTGLAATAAARRRRRARSI